ncbi:MAG: hypothetical protein JRH20_27535, partial [Deltaproteobacteria bacterium]|nr:hypothetical protein [Deltaproteobacteria bacterium]
VRLRPGGKIEGVSAAQGHRWKIVDRIVVFYGRDKKAIVRFTQVRLSHAKLAMRGTPLGRENTLWVLKERGYKPPLKQAMPSLTHKQAMARSFVLSKRHGEVLAKRLRLRPKGKIVGYSAENAKRWDLREGKVVFFDEAGKISVRFGAIRFFKNKLELMGSFLKNRKITLVLREPGFTR